MIKQSIIHRMLVDEIREFKRKRLKPNKIVMSQDILHHMLGWDEVHKYFIPEHQVRDSIPRYYGLELVVSIAKHSDDETKTSGECFVCCAASSGKVEGIFY